MPLDIAATRAHFPALKEGAAHFDGAGGSQTPDVVGDAVRDLMLSAVANDGTVTTAEQRATDSITAARAAMADLLAADPRGVVFGRSMTQLTMDLARTLAKDWTSEDEVVVSRLDHDANVRPWVIAAQAKGATVRWVDFDPQTAELTPDDVRAVLSERTRLVALTGASNLIGTRPDLPAVAEVVHDHGALFFVDAVHLSAHASVDLAGFGADVVVCSPYKFFGPHCGVLAADPALLETLSPDKLAPSSNAVPDRFELGTLPYELLAGVTAAVDFIASLADVAIDADARTTRRGRLVQAMALVDEHEERLRRRIEAAMAERGDVTMHSRASRRTPTLLMTFDRHDSAEASVFLAARGVNAPAGSFYAYEPTRRLGLGEPGGLRIGLAPYNSDEDVDRLLEGLDAFLGPVRG